MLDTQKILAKFADERTPEQIAFDNQVEAEWAAYDAEIAPIMAANDPQKWEKAEVVAAGYRKRGFIFPHPLSEVAE